MSLGFGIINTNEKRLIFFHITSENSDAIYNSVHLFILPFLRLTTGRMQHISTIQTKVNIYFVIH